MKPFQNSRLGTVFLIACVVLIAALNVLDPVPNAYLTTVIFSVRTVLTFVMLILWIYTLRMRILISRARDYLSAMGAFILLLYLIQTVKYRVLDDYEIPMRYAWYSYYIPLVMICILFVMTCISFNDRKKLRGFNELWLLLPASLLSLMVMTNDLHHMVFIPKEGETFDGGSSSYTHNFGFYMIYVYYFLCIAAGMVFLVLAFRSNKELKRKTVYPFLFLIPWVAVNSVLYFFVIKDYTRHHLNITEIFIFGAIGVIEVCISSGLIPHNENYIGFFKSSRLPSVITDKELVPVYATEAPLNADPHILSEAAVRPIYNSDKELKISGMAIRGGYVFWGTDESGIRKLNAELEQANELLSSENALLKAENDLRSQEIAFAERQKLNRTVAEKMRPYINTVRELLDSTDPGAPDFSEKIIRISTINCIIKRGANMLLSAEENGFVHAQQLLYAIKELATVYHINHSPEITVTYFSDFLFPAEEMIALLDSVRILFDMLSQVGTADVGVIIEDRSCVLIAEGTLPNELEKTPFPVTVFTEDDFIRLTVSAKGGDQV